MLIKPSLMLPLTFSFAIYAAKILSIQELPSRSLGILPKGLIDVPSVPIQSEWSVCQHTDFLKKQSIRAGGFSHFSSPGLLRLRRSFSVRFAPIKPQSYAGYQLRDNFYCFDVILCSCPGFVFCCPECNSTMLCKINSQLVSLLPVGILQMSCLICFIFVCNAHLIIFT